MLHLNRALAILLIFQAAILFAFQSFGQPSLDINVSNVQINQGKVIVEIYQNSESWLDRPFREATLPTDAEAITASFQVPLGKYAIAIYQDTDDDGEMDSNFLGIPKEPIGFGNNYKPFGKPKFESAAIEHTPTSGPHEIKLDN
jgi:uncharacterized protein (DUF2141 family)